MSDGQRESARAALSIIEDQIAGAAASHDRPVAALGTHEDAMLAFSYLAGFTLQLLAAHRGEEVAATARFVRHVLDGGGDAGSGEPRRPPPPDPGSSSAAVHRTQGA